MKNLKRIYSECKNAQTAQARQYWNEKLMNESIKLGIYDVRELKKMLGV